MKHFNIPYKLLLYWFKAGIEKPVNSDFRRLNKRSFKDRVKMHEQLHKYFMLERRY